VRRLALLLVLAVAYAGEARADWGADGKPAFLEAQRSPDWKVRKLAYVAAADHDGGDVVPTLLQAASGEPNPAVVAAALDTLAGLRTAPARLALAEALRKGKPDARVLAAAALATHKGAEVDAALTEALSATDTRVVAHAALALAHDGHTRSAAPLLPLLAHLDRRVRGAAARALGAAGDKSAIPPLAARLPAESGPARLEIVRALEALSGQALGDAPAKWKAVAEGKDPEAVKEAAKPFPTAFGLPIVGERVVFVLDTSLLMADAHPFDRKRLEALSTPPDGEPIVWFRLKTKLQIAVSQIEHAVAGLSPGTKVEVVHFNKDVRGAFGLKLTPVNAGSRKALGAALGSIETDDGINIYDALQTAFGLGGATDSAAWKSGPDQILFVINNIPNHGEITDAADVGPALGTKGRLRIVPIHVVGIGHHPYQLAETVAKRSGGTYLSLVK
jgi:HEAT repeat protein